MYWKNKRPLFLINAHLNAHILLKFFKKLNKIKGINAHLNAHLNIKIRICIDIYIRIESPPGGLFWFPKS